MSDFRYDFDPIGAMNFVNESIAKIGEWGFAGFTSTVAMLVEEYCSRHGRSAKETFRMLAEAASDIEDELGVYHHCEEQEVSQYGESISA